MKTNFIVIILSIIITISVIFAIIQSSSFFPKEHYEIKMTGLDDAYLIDESFSFGYVISGYGYSCGKIIIHIPDENGDSQLNTLSDCKAHNNMQYFEHAGIFDSGNATFVHPGIKNSGIYNISVTYEHGVMEPTMGGKTFHIVEKICNLKNPADNAQCFANNFKSCTSSYIELGYPTNEGDTIFVTGVIESWYNCTLRVYTDHMQDKYRGDNSGTRSICDGIRLDDDSIIFDNCNNEEIPPLRFEQQFYVYKEKCEMYGGWWDFQFNNCVGGSMKVSCDAPSDSKLIPPDVFDKIISVDGICTSHELFCKSIGGTPTCMSYEQKEHGRDICNTVCEFESTERK